MPGGGLAAATSKDKNTAAEMLHASCHALLQLALTIQSHLPLIVTDQGPAGSWLDWAPEAMPIYDITQENGHEIEESNVTSSDSDSDSEDIKLIHRMNN